MLFMVIAFVVSGCTISFEGSNSGQSSTDGGVFKSLTSGSTWTQKAAIATVSGQPVSFNNENILSLAIDPQDNYAIYAGTEKGGLLYSYDGGASWSIARTLGKRVVQAIAVNPIDKCILLAASENRIFNSVDCARTWDEVYFDNNTSVLISDVAFSPSQENVVFAGTSRGEVIGSSDRGLSWKVLKRFSDSRRSADNAVTSLAVSEKNPRSIWAATAGSGVYRSSDGGANWQGFLDAFNAIDSRNARAVSHIALGQRDGKTVVAATAAGLLRSLDGGEHWHVLDLIPPKDKIAINTAAVFAGDSNRIYYATNTSFGWTDDGGKTWSSKKLPSGRRGVTVAVDYDNGDVVYLGVQAIKK
jgi:hypothetical protein